MTRPPLLIDRACALCGGVGYLQRVTDRAMVKCIRCDGSGVRPADPHPPLLAPEDCKNCGTPFQKLRTSRRRLCGDCRRGR